MVHGFFLGDYLPRQATSNLVALIPKIERPNRFSNYALLVDEHQSGLVKGRSIQESITLAQELVQDIDRKKEWGNVIFKTDMSKAYDRLEWRFIILTLKAMS